MARHDYCNSQERGVYAKQARRRFLAFRCFLYAKQARRRLIPGMYLEHTRELPAAKPSQSRLKFDGKKTKQNKPCSIATKKQRKHARNRPAIGSPCAQEMTAATGTKYMKCIDLRSQDDTPSAMPSPTSGVCMTVRLFDEPRSTPSRSASAEISTDHTSAVVEKARYRLVVRHASRSFRALSAGKLHYPCWQL